MPAKHIIKDFQPNSHYHVYNRGAYKRDIYLKQQDFWIFRSIVRQKMKKLNGKIVIRPFSLLPNHYHFLLWQQGKRDMEHFMRSVITSYGRYFCSKYKHTGRIFEGPYKAILLETSQDVWRVRKYILSNPSEAGYYNWPHVGLEI